MIGLTEAWRQTWIPKKGKTALPVIGRALSSCRTDWFSMGSTSTYICFLSCRPRPSGFDTPSPLISRCLYPRNAEGLHGSTVCLSPLLSELTFNEYSVLGLTGAGKSTVSLFQMWCLFSEQVRCSSSISRMVKQSPKSATASSPVQKRLNLLPFVVAMQRALFYSLTHPASMTHASAMKKFSNAFVTG
jgi:hypothetical protein